MVIRDIVGELPTHRYKKYGVRNLHLIDSIIIHHSGSDNDDPWRMARWHVDGRDWPGIGYHCVIMPSGEVFKTNNDSTISYHASGHNTNSIGICLQGNYEKKKPPYEQMLALLQVLDRYRKAYRIDWKNIKGHREVGATNCPGTEIDIDAIRTASRLLRG